MKQIQFTVNHIATDNKGNVTKEVVNTATYESRTFYGSEEEVDIQIEIWMDKHY